MNKFFFDIQHGDQLSTDAEGTECPDAQAAAREAMVALGEMARDEVRTATRFKMAIIVRDASNREVATATLQCELAFPLD